MQKLYESISNKFDNNYAAMKFSAILSLFKKKPKKPPSVVTFYRNKKRLSRLSIKDLDLLEGKNVEDIIKKYPLTPSKTKALDKMIVDYRKGNLSLSGSTTSKYKKKKLNKDKLEKLITDYEEAKKKRRNSLSLRIIDKFKELDVAELKKKFSLTSSKGKLYNQMIEDYKDKKVSLSRLSNKSKFDPKNMSKEKLNKILRD
ncbi:uncharacterized protein LOC114363439, partial [Ostrinia furnacalis]|uniref:uncharacterized protein LOC114363439 n=1 Tax=Ostrinia furnacalis TaxID=93504 RepID=UPI00103BF29A